MAIKLEPEDLMAVLPNLNELWVFGYGSIIWNPGFEYNSTKLGIVPGFSRKMWQGSTTHRGTLERPGRVATIIKDDASCVWGKAFHLIGKSQIVPCLEHLGLRECVIGGYSIYSVPFIPEETLKIKELKNINNFTDFKVKHRSSGLKNVLQKDFYFTDLKTNKFLSNHNRIKASNKHNGIDNLEELNSNNDNLVLSTLCFIAMPNNSLYLGPSTLEDMASCIAYCSGVSGPCCEYLFKLVDFLRDFDLMEFEEDLFVLDEFVKEYMNVNLTKDKITKNNSISVENNQSVKAAKISDCDKLKNKLANLVINKTFLNSKLSKDDSTSIMSLNSYVEHHSLSYSLYSSNNSLSSMSHLSSSVGSLNSISLEDSGCIIK